MAPLTPQEEIYSALASVETARMAVDRAVAALEGCLKRTGEAAFNQCLAPALPSSEHRRAHRPGVAPKIDSDPELRAYIIERLDCFTYQEIADLIAKRFPPERHVHASTIHRWWQRRVRTQQTAPR
jgi:hypothetical protein